MFMTLISCAAAYILGSVPNGLWLGKVLWDTDLREHGSHNIGATNAWRTLGKIPGIIVFLLDFLKGFLSVYLASVWVGEPVAMVLAAIFAIIGHSASLFLGFRGGKGVATGLGVISMLMPQVTIIVFLTWLVIVKLTGFVSLGSIIGAALVPLLAWQLDCPTAYIIFGILAAVLIIVRHKANIGRLMNGTEGKIKAGHR